MRENLAPLTDEELLERFTRGDSAAFEVLLERYQRPIYNFILRSVRETARAEDLLQDVFLRVIQRAEDFRGQAKFSTWLYTITRNLCIDASRKMSHRRHPSLDAPSVRDDEGSTPLVERVAAPQADTDRRAAGPDLQAAIARAVEALPEDQREVFLMRQVEGLRFQDIAAIVGVPENTIKSRMRYALERLQEALADYQDYVDPLK